MVCKYNGLAIKVHVGTYTIINDITVFSYYVRILVEIFLKIINDFSYHILLYNLFLPTFILNKI